MLGHNSKADGTFKTSLDIDIVNSHVKYEIHEFSTDSECILVDGMSDQSRMCLDNQQFWSENV